MMILKIALKNLKSAGIRTFLTASVLSLTLASMIFMQALMAGWQDEMMTARTYEETAGGELWHEMYDPYDPLTLDDSRALIPNEMKPLLEKGEACPNLMVGGAIYPSGRFKSAKFMGIDPDQDCLRLDFTPLKQQTDGLMPVMIGRRWAKSLKLTKGDQLTLRWRTQEGAFDARDAQVVAILESQVPFMDTGLVYITQERLNQMMGTEGYVTKIWVKEGKTPPEIEGWKFSTPMDLMRDSIEMVEAKQMGQSFFYSLLLFLGLVAVFDTQALSVFRRKKEIGTFMAMGMSNRKVLALFVLEGFLNGVLATLLTLIWAGPLFWWSLEVGISFGGITGDQWGMVMGDRMYPAYKLGKVLGAVFFINAMVLLVSFWPVRQITKMLPANALRGRSS